MFLEALLWQRFVTGFPVRLWSGEAGKRGKRLLNKKKSIANTIFLVLIFALTLYSVFHGEDLPAVLRTIGEVNPWYLIPGTAGVILFIWGESIIIWYMFGTLDIHEKKRTCFLYSCVGFFFSAVTPSAVFL